MYISLCPFLLTILKILLQFWIKMSEEEQNIVKYRKHKKTGLNFFSSFATLEIVITSVSHITGQEGAVSQNYTSGKACFVQASCPTPLSVNLLKNSVFFGHLLPLYLVNVSASYNLIPPQKYRVNLKALTVAPPRKMHSCFSSEFFLLLTEKKPTTPPTYCVLHAVNT